MARLSELREAAAYRTTRGGIGFAMLVASLLLLSGLFSGIAPGELFTSVGMARATEIASGLMRPALGGDLLQRIVVLLGESAMIGALGVFVALLLAIPLTMVATRLPTLPAPPSTGDFVLGWRAARWGARSILAVMRSVPEIVWAYLFVRVFGLGPAPAVLAIGLSFAGIIGKLFSEQAEAVDPAPVRALRSAGAGRVGLWIYGILPQVRAGWSGYALFRLECAIRSAAILGVVGAGGLGAEIELSIRYFQYDRLATALLALGGVMVILELWSHHARERAGFWAEGTIVLSAIAGFVLLEADWGALVEGSAWRSAGNFVGAFLTPTTTSAFVLQGLKLAGETVAMAMFATVVASIVAVVVAPWASRSLALRRQHAHAPSRSGWPLMEARVFEAGVRLIAGALRAMPELVWALIFVAWVGPGTLAGILAVALHTIGVLVRLFADVYEDADRGPARALEAAGAGRAATWAYAIFPQTAPRLAAFALFRFEVNIRATTMVGFVGAGGLGDALHTSISLFHWNDLAGLLLVLLFAVLVADGVGDHLRARLISK